MLSMSTPLRDIQQAKKDAKEVDVNLEQFFQTLPPERRSYF